MTTIVSGHGLGLQDGSAGQLNRNDQTSKGTLGLGVESYLNVANGNLLIQERDVFLPSQGMDFALTRTYNSRGAIQGSSDGWWWSTGAQLSKHQDTPATSNGAITNYTMVYGDGSQLHFDFDAGRNLWFATDGAGAYESLQEAQGNAAVKYTVTRADQTQYRFDKDFVLLAIVDSNGVTTSFTYQGGRIQTVADDTGHLLVYQYDGIGKLAGIVDRHAGQDDVRLVTYTYSQSQLSQVTDRFGHVTTYTYDNNGLLIKASLPFQQTVGGLPQSFDTREIQFTYERVAWSDNPHLSTAFDSGSQWIVTSITDPLGGVTRFAYDFRFDTTAPAAGDRDLNYKVTGGRYFAGGTTRVTDALGFTVAYSYDADGYITRVVDQQGLATVYTYGGKTPGEAQTAVNQDNLLSVTDRNGAGATTSDSAYFRELRRDLGIVDLAGNGKLVAALTAAEISQLLDKFTSRFTYDVRGNLLTSTDAQGNQSSYTYTAFNKVLTATSAIGNAQPAQRALYTTTYAYDAKQNLVTRTDPGGDITRFEYDVNGNLTKRTVEYRNATGTPAAAKNQVTTYAYDGFGNNTSIVDGEGATTIKTYDHFGNLLTSRDGRLGVTTYSYDADNRLLTQTDPEGHQTINRYDAVGNRISVTDAAGKTVTQVFDRNNLLITTIDPSLADPAFTRTTSFRYDILGNRTEVTDAEGRKTVYSYDARRQLVDARTPQVLNAAGTLTSYTTSYAYDGESRIVSTTDNNGALTQSLYLSNGLLKRVTDPVGNVTEYLYDANLQQVQITIGAQFIGAQLPLRRVLKFSYDEENQLVAQTDALGFITRNAVDAPGNVVAVTDANGNATQFDYDRNNRLVKETRPLLPGQTAATAYTVLHKFDANGNEIETTDENGHTTKYTFDKDDNQVMVTDANGIETVFTYDSRHNQTRISIGGASQGQVTTFKYDEFNQIIESTDGVGNALVTSDASVYQQLRKELGFVDANGNGKLVAALLPADITALLNRFTERFAYDRVGNLVKSVDNLGRITALEYDALNRLQQRTEDQGVGPNFINRVTSLRYDGNGNVVKTTDALGRATTSTYDAANRLTGTTSPLNVTTKIEYDNVGNIVASTEADGALDAAGNSIARKTTYVYDLNDRLTRERDSGNHQIAYEYDAVGNRMKVIDARGGATQYAYDALNRNVRIIDPLSFTTRYEYDGVGNRITLTDPRGGITRFEYDPGNRQVKTTDAEGRVTQLAYDPLGNVITQTTAANNAALAEVTRFVYDAEGNLRSTTDALGKAATQGFDEVYNLTRSTDRNGHTTTYGFDALNRQIRITDPLGGVTEYTYDAADNRLTEKDALGRTRSFVYDAGDRLITETDALLTQTTYTYNALDNQIAITRAAGTPQAATTSFFYNADDQLVRQVDALGKATEFVYDANHNVTRVVDANLHGTDYEYDANDRVKRIVDALGNATRFAYDGNGNRTQVIDARGNATTSYYNADNEVVLTVDAKGFASARSYDANGNVVSETLFMTPLAVLPVDPATRPVPTASGRDQTTRYGYDKLNRLTSLTDALGGGQAVGYDAVGNRTSETDENGHTTTFAYDANDRRVTTTDAKGGVTRSTFDKVGNKLSETDANLHTTENAYDANNRLISSTNALGEALGGKTRFTYDAVGNLLTRTDALGRVVTSKYDLVDRVVEQTDALGIKSQRSYDAVGNVLSETSAVGNPDDEATTTFTYDELNRVATEADGLSQVTRFGYDANGNRTSETEPDGQTTTTTFDALDRQVQVTDAAGRTVETGFDGAGNEVTEKDANNRTRVDYYDRNNRLVLTVDAGGFAESYTYDAAGNLTANTRHVTKLTTLPFDPNVLPAVTANAADKTTSYEYDELDRIATITDGEGYVTSFKYDAVGNQTESRQQVDKNVAAKDEVTRQYYDPLDRLIATVSGEGHLSTVKYDKVGNATERTDHEKTYTPPADGTPPVPAADDPGRKSEAIYDEKGRLVEQTDSAGVKTKHEYDERGNETKTIDAVGTPQERTQQTKFDKADRVVESTDALGVVTRYKYDKNDNVVELTEDALGNARTTAYDYNNLNQLIRQTDALGTINEYRYDGFGNKTGQTLAKGKPEERIESFEYDGNNQLIAQVNGEGERTRFEYDGAGNQTKIVTAEGLPGERIRSFEYDRDHRVSAEVDGNGVRTEYRYDGQGNRTDIFQAVNRAGETRHSVYEYDKDSRLLSVTDPLAGITRFEYDAAGNQTKITDANGAVTRNTFDALGRITTTISGVGGAGVAAGGVKTVNEYDARSNIVKTVQSFADGSDARTTSYAYDALDRQTLVTDGEGFSTRFTYDAFGNQTRLETGLYLVPTTDAAYSAAKAARADTVSLSFGYDKLDRLVTTTTGANGVVASSYDAFGNRLTQTTRAGDGSDARTVTFKYDDASRLTERTTPAGGLDTFKYDKAGNQIERRTLQSGSGAGAVVSVTTFAFDGNGKVTLETDALGAKTLHVLDAVGNEVETVFASGAGAAVERSLKSVFDLNNQLTAEIDAEGKRTDYVIDKAGNRVKETDALGRVTHLYYDALGQHVGTLDPERYFTAFVRDAMGNIAESRIYLNRYAVPAADLVAPVPAAADPLRRVTSTFDRAGNPVAQVGAAGGREEFEYSSTRKLLKQTTIGNADAADIARTNIEAPRVITFEYDSADRLVKFTNVDGVIETYAYDSANNKTSETVTNPNLLAGGRSDPVRTTRFEYDLDNRLTRQIFDSAGLNLIEQVGYDAVGNVVRRVDANGNATSVAYDLGNRQTSVTDALAGTIRYAYDLVGNRTSVTDARGNVTDLKYDRNGLVIEEKKPAVAVFTIAGGAVANVRPTTTTRYDAAGNIVQIIDAAGNKTTRYYDGNDNLVAELNGDNALREYGYNATDDVVTVRQYMTRLAPTAHDPLLRPTVPGGDVRTVTNEYDAGGRLLRTVYPAIDVTTLSGVSTGSPTATTTSAVVSERNLYDRFGNLVESFDRNGNRTLSYFDQRDRVVAAVDPSGFLTESDFDSQGSVVQQRQYSTALSIATLSAGTRPTPAGTPAAVVDRVYDAANRLFEETSAGVQTATGQQRVITRFAYDQNGNQRSRTVAFGTTDAATEYFFYDALNRRVGAVNTGRVLAQFGYDANGNNTLLKRYFDPVSAGVALASASFAAVLADVTPDPANDQEKASTYDALNRQTKQTDLLGPGTTDDIVVSTQYDSVGNVSARTDARGHVSKSAHNAVGSIIQSVTPDGNSTFAEYDTGGLRVRSWTGDLGSIQAVQATGVAATIGDDLRISYNVGGTNALRSYVVYDTAQHDLPAQYAKQTSQQGAGAVSVGIALDATLPAGTVVYFRVVTVDAAGSTAWTEERSVTIAARLTALDVRQVGANIEVTVRFSGTVTSPTLRFGPRAGPFDSTAGFVDQGGGNFKATFTPGSDPQGLAYQVSWVFASNTFTTAARSFEAPGAHVAVGPTLTWTVPPGVEGTSAPNGQFVIVDGVRIAGAFQANKTLQFDPGLTGARNDVVYHVYYGDLSPSTHAVSVSFEDHQSTTVLSDTTVIIPLSRVQVLRWQTDSRHTHIAATLSTTEAAAIGGGGLHAAFKAASDTDVFSGGDVTMTAAGGGVFNAAFTNLAAGSYDILVYYFDSAGKQVIVEWRRITVPPAAALPADLSITDSTIPFDFAGQTATSGGVSDSTFPFNLSRTVTTAPTLSVTGNSVTVFATERLGTIDRTAAGVLTVDPGLYSGGLDPNAAPFTLTTAATGRAGPSSAKSDGLSAGTYFIETLYNALGVKIATNEDTGIWRRFGVDANGNAVQTRAFGTRAVETAGLLAPLVTFTAFDARNLEVAQFGAAAAIDSNGDGTNEAGTARSVTRSTYDFAGRLLTRTDPTPGAVARTFQYDGTGNVVRETNALGAATTYLYDRRGRETRRTDALGHFRTRGYDAFGRMTSEADGAGTTTTFGYDAFDREIRITDGLSNSTRQAYDQRNLLTSVTDGAGKITRYTYDKRGDRVLTVDANDHFWFTSYDSMRRVTANSTFHGAVLVADDQTSYDIFGNKASERDAENRVRYFSYGAFGRLVSQTDEGGRVTNFSYDRFGSPTGETNATSGKSIARVFDSARRLVSVTDSATGVTTTYTYDAGGSRRHETVRAPDFATPAVVATARNVTYGYDGSGQMTSWIDSVTGKRLAYTYDAVGNLKTVVGGGSTDPASTDHRYTYDAADRLTLLTQGASTTLTAYTYDAAGNRKTYNDGTTTTTYNYDAAGRLSTSTRGGTTFSSWTYDAVGNITKYTELNFTQTTTYSENNRILSVATKDDRDANADNHSDNRTDNTLDKSGRVLTETLTDIKNENKTTTFQHTYTADGRETSVTVIGGTSGSSGSSASTYDANDKLIRVDLGQSDGQDSAEFKRFIYNNDGQILRRFHDDGKNDTTNTNINTTTQYLYALGNPVGETGNDATGATVTLLDTGNYDLIDNIGEKFPVSSVSEYTVRAGDTLQSIAGQIYGNPSLWFVIADANGLTGDERLKEGTSLKIPNTVELGRLTSDTHAIYKESEIVGSTLPNLKAPPPDDSAKCAAIGAIIGLILLAIVGVILSIVTVGAAAPAAAAFFGAAFGATAGIIAGVLVGAAIGAAIAFTVSALSQLILVGAGLQKEFDWTQVLADTAVGFISGGVAGLGELISAGILVGRVAKIATVVASAVLEATGETLRQVIVNPDHRPDNPLSIVIAGAGGAFGAVAAIATRAASLQSARKIAGAVERSGLLDKSLTIGTKFRNTVRKLQDGTKIVRIVQKDGSVLFKQVTRVSAVAKGAPFVSKTIDFIAEGAKGADKIPTRTLAKIVTDIQAVKALTVGQRAAAVVSDAFGPAIPNAVSKLSAKVAPIAKIAATAVGRVTGKIGAAISGAARSAATVIGGATGKVGTVIGNAAKALVGALKAGARAAASEVGRLGRNIGSGLAKLGGVLAKPFRAAAQGLVRTALGANAAGKFRAVRALAIGALLPAVAVGKLGSLVARGVSKVASVVATGARSASTAIAKFGTKVTVGFEKIGAAVAKVANGAAQKAGSAVRAIGKKLEPVSRELENVGIILGKLGRAVGRKAKDIVLGKLDPTTLPFTLIGAGLSGGRVVTRNEGDPGKQRARYFQSDARRSKEGERIGFDILSNGDLRSGALILGRSRPAYGTQGPAGGIGKALFGVLSGDLPFRPAYRPTIWENNAAATTTGVYSGFSIDRAIDLRSVNALNQIRLGRVATLDRQTRDAFAAQVIGRVSANADEVPINLLDPLAPDPSPLFG